MAEADNTKGMIKDRLQEGRDSSILSSLEVISGAALPTTFKIGRQGFFRLKSVERDLFTEQRERNSGSYVISGIDGKRLSKAKLSEADLLAFNAAIYKALYNQSYISGNQDTNSGLSRKEAKKATEAQRAEASYKAAQESNPKRKKALELAARESIAYKGEVVVALHELCKDGYGDTKATTLHKKSMETLIKLLDSTPVTIHYANGDVGGTYVCKITEFYKREKDGAIFYNLHLNPAYTENVVKNFGELPQNAIEQLAANTKKLTAPPMKLLILLSLQRKDVPFSRTIAELLEEIGIDIETYKINKNRAEKQIIDLCETMVKVGIASTYTPTYTTSARGRKQLSKVTFILNKDYGKEAEKEG